MKTIFRSCIVTILLAAVCPWSYAQHANQITGISKTDDKSKDFQMEIYLAKDGTYYGKIINDNSKSSKNGTLVLKKLSYNENSKNYKGSMTPPDTNITLNVTLTAENNDRLKLVARKFLMSKTMYLMRIK
jgi:uncharacterized cupredoxin-like copper-binding protein